MKNSFSKKEILKQAALGFGLSRTAYFALQQRTLPLAHLLATGEKTFQPENKNEKLKKALETIFELLKSDSDNIANGLYPIEVLQPENPFRNSRRFIEILRDGMQIARRRSKKSHSDFSPASKQLEEGLPEYYTRNFHFQTDGYLSDESAELYEHQVEILFAGAADAMRRLLIPLLKNQNLGDGEGMQFLELGCGTGRLTKFMALAFPKARIIAIDPSDAYLQKAKQRLSKFERVNFAQGFAEKLNFKNETFDLVYSCFLFHELPKAVRVSVQKESARVLKPEGLLGIVDSLQLGDNPEFDWALQQFPVDFHEPFYKDYSVSPLVELMETTGYSIQQNQQQGFLSKALLGRKISK